MITCYEILMCLHPDIITMPSLLTLTLKITFLPCSIYHFQTPISFNIRTTLSHKQAWSSLLQPSYQLPWSIQPAHHHTMTISLPLSWYYLHLHTQKSSCQNCHYHNHTLLSSVVSLCHTTNNSHPSDPHHNHSHLTSLIIMILISTTNLHYHPILIHYQHQPSCNLVTLVSHHFSLSTSIITFAPLPFTITSIIFPNPSIPPLPPVI